MTPSDLSYATPLLPEKVTPIPGPKSLELAARLSRYECRNVTYLAPDFPVFWQTASGTNIWDVDGNRFIDLTSAFGVSGLGHAFPPVRDAMIEQAKSLPHAMGDVHPTEAKARLCELLSAITFERWDRGTGRTTLGCSGSDAVEIALKTALLHSGKPGIIAFHGSYHGLGLGAVDTCGLPIFREPFKSQLARFTTLVPFPHCYRCPFDRREEFRIEGRPFPNCSSTCLEALHDEIEAVIEKREIGAILVEPIQGRGGIIPPPRDFLPMLREICDIHKILLIADEIYTGFNRTGRLFAVDHFETAPDIICLAKGMASGYPISACVGRSDIMEAWPPSEGEALQTSTFLGNPVGCAMAIASIEAHTDPETRKLVKQTARHLRSRLDRLESRYIGQIRGAGLMLGVELIDEKGEPHSRLAGSILSRALGDGLILLADGPGNNVLGFTPPFALSQAQIDWAGDRIQEYLTSLPGSIS